MLYTGKVKVSADAWPIPNKSEFGKHTSFPADARLGILAETKDKKWVWAYPLAGGPTAWVESKNVTKEKILLVDTYWKDLPKPNWQALAGTPEFFGAIIKVSQNTSYPKGAVKWFKDNWKILHDIKAKLSTPFFIGGYHYLICKSDGAKQAEYYANIVSDVGGFRPGDILPAVDLEEKGNEGVPKEDVIACTKAFVNQMKKFGYDVMLYGNGLMRDLNIKDRMGCKKLWIPRYTEKLPKEIYERAGWKLEDVAFWQYAGDSVGKLKGYPLTVPGFSDHSDISVFLGGNLADLRNNACVK